MENTLKNDIVQSFFDFVNIGDKSLIDMYTLEQLESVAIVMQEEAQSLPYYKALIGRIGELNEFRKAELARREKWNERFINLGFSSIIVFIGFLIKRLLTGNW
jgi:hypothetical protein